MRRLGALVAIATLALAGCVRISAETTLGEDDTFSQTAVIAVTDQARTALRQQLGQLELPDVELPDGVEAPELATDLDALLDPDTVREQLAPLEEEYPGSVAVEPYSDEDGREGVRIDITDLPLDAAADTSGAAPLTGGTSIVREDDAYVVTLELGAASDLGGVGGSELSLVANAVDVSVAFTFPGLVREASAGEVEGSTVTLGLTELLGADTIRIVGGAETEIDWGPWLRWGLVTLAALVIVGGAVALVIQDRRRRARTDLPPPRESSPGGPGTLGGTDASSSGDDAERD